MFVLIDFVFGAGVLGIILVIAGLALGLWGFSMEEKIIIQDVIELFRR